MFIKDPIFLLKDLFEDNDKAKTYEFFNNSQFKSCQFKLPPYEQDENNMKIGWRVEFRPLDLQFTDFENTAFAAFIILLARTIRRKHENI